MTLPVQAKTWVFSLNNRITYVSLNDLSAAYMFGIKVLLKANGYTVKGSCDGTTGSMDGTDRWATKANCTTRFNGAAGAQSWIVLTDKNGVDILICYSGATDDVFAILMSPTGDFTIAGTANQQPTTATGFLIEQGSMVGTTTSGDRVWNAMVSSDGKMFRAFILRSNITAGPVFGVEAVSSACISPAVFNPASIGWVFDASTTMVTANFFVVAVAGKSAFARTVISGTPINVTAGPTVETGGGTVTSFGFSGSLQAELQGSTGPLIVPLGLYSATASAKGKLANRIDMYFSYDTQADGAVTIDKKWIFLTHSSSAAQGGILLPWDGATTPVLA